MRKVLAAAVLALLCSAAPAQAAFTLGGASAAPGDKRAGAHSDVAVHVEPQGGQIKDLVLQLPRGLIGDPSATPKCPIATFERGPCPANTQVGRSSTSVMIGPLPQTASGTIYNLAPRGGEPARLGIRIVPPTGGPVNLESPVTSRPDGGLTSTLQNLPRQISGIDVTITALDVVLLGRTGEKTFMRNPTGCDPAETVFEATSYAGEKATSRAAFTPTDCGALPFAPGFEAVLGAPGLMRKGDAPPVRTIVTQTGEQAGVRTVAVTLPPAVSVGFDKLARACPEATFAAGGCPPSAQIGDATAITPLLSAPLQGPVSFITAQGNLPDLVLQLTGPLGLTLRGTNTLTPAGQVTTFDGLPDVPLSRFELAFRGGAEGLLTLQSDQCRGKRPRFSAAFTSQSGATRSVNVPATLVGCRPVATARYTRRRTQPTLRVRVDAGAARLRRVRIALPAGLRAVRAPRVSGSEARGARVTRGSRSVEVRVPGKGARSVAVVWPRGALRVRGRVARRPRVRVESLDATGARSRETATARG